MSTAFASPTLTSLPERAFSLHCSGLRSPAIAAQLGVPERTVRAWIARIRDDLAADNTAILRDEFLRAVEHLHQLSAAAWAAFENEQAASHPLPNDPHAALPSAETATRSPSLASASAAAPLSPQGAARTFVGASGGRPRDAIGAERAEREAVGSGLRPLGQGVRFPRHGPRYLRLALDAQRHISRLFGHFDDLRSDLRSGPLDLTPTSTPASPATPPALVLSPIPDTESEIPAKTAIGVSPLPQGVARAEGSDDVAAERAVVGAGFPPKRSLLEREGGTAACCARSDWAEGEVSGRIGNRSQ